jgi:tetratricopeptide (TPR) repeat protein
MALAFLLFSLQSGSAPALADTAAEADSLFKQADSYDICENYREASAKYLELISKLRQSDPNNPKILRASARLARIDVVLKHFDAAEPIFHVLVHTDRKKLTIDPELTIDLDDLSDAYSNIKTDPHYGYESMKRCAALRKYIDPDHQRLPDIYGELARYCEHRGQPKECIDWTQKAIVLDKKQPPQKQIGLIRDLTYLAGIYIKDSQYEKALQTCREASSYMAHCPAGKNFAGQLHVEVGRIYTRKGLFDQADKEFRLALGTAPRFGEIKKDWPGYIKRYQIENDMLRKRSQGKVN